ncbi:ATPase [Candidatus Pacearchaeota archaeon]|nr:ATPase [Candidatus Pacearchaeota archaeon]|tara:strand:- start:4353 stop:6152 length:1800 start_codon:yes stop_codon:yes gene_type:complete
MSEIITSETSEPEVLPIEEKQPNYKNAMEEILALIRGRAPIIWVLTHEENRFINDFMEAIATPCKRDVWLWSAYQGLIRQDQQLSTERASGEDDGTWNPQKALKRICEMHRTSDSKGTCFIMRDFHTVLGEPIPRQIRDMYEHLIGTGKTLIILSPLLAHGAGGNRAGIPPTLEKQTSVVRYELPTKNVIEEHITEVVSHMNTSTRGKKKYTKLDYDINDIQGFVKALQGLTLIEIDNAISTSITHMNKLDADKLLMDKKQLLRKSEILEFIHAPVAMDDVGGLDMIKDYLGKYSRAYTPEAKAFGVEPLKGVLLTGVPGTGKSLLAKAIGRLWQVPLLRLDVGKVMTGLVGGSESKMRDVIKQAEAMSPCVLWIDEVEKSLSGTKSSNFSDGGTLARVFGTLLTAMQDGMEGVTIIATANDITMLPPEFIRRFNEVFFVDLPGPDERWDIFGIHLSKRGRDISKFEQHKKVLVSVTDGFTGAEIEKAIKDGIAASFYQDKKDLTIKNLLGAITDTKPISRVMAEKVKKLRDKARGSFRFASSYAMQEAKQNKKKAVKTASGKKLNIDDAIDDVGVFKQTKKEESKSTKDAVDSRFSDL